MPFQLNEELSEIMDELVSNWFRLHFNEVNETMPIKEEDEDPNGNDEENEEHIIFEYFNADRSFGEFALEEEVFEEHFVSIIQYTNEFLEENYGDDFLLDWKRYGDLEYIYGQFGYAYSSQNRENLVIEFYGLRDVPILK